MCIRDSDNAYCASCWDEHCEVIHEYSYTPDLVFHGKGLRHFGVELEIDDGGTVDVYKRQVSVRSARNPTVRSSNITEPCFVRRKLTLALARLRRCFGQLPSATHLESRRTTGAVAVAASLR